MNKTAVWQFFWEPATAWPAMLAACQAARQSIDLEQFILEPDELGRQFLEVCAERARAGVRVRLLCDAAGSRRLWRSRWPAWLAQHGVGLAPFNTFWPGSAHNQHWWFFRDHQKLLVVDGEVGFTGGLGLGFEMRSWRDTHVELTGPVVRQMSAAFNEMWRRAERRPRPRRALPPARGDFSYLVNYPLPGRRQLFQQLLGRIRASRASVALTTPFFVPDYRLRLALIRAARRGVAVSLLLPLQSDHPLADWAARTYFAELLAAGVKVYLYQGEMIHAKTAVIDERWASVGSLNLDHLSIFYNFEANIVSANSHFARDLAEQFAVDLTRARELSLVEWRRRPWRVQLVELLVRPLRMFL